MKFLHFNANEMNYVAAIHEGITGIHTVIQITSQILLRLFLTELYNAERLTNRTLPLMSTNPRWRRMLTPISHPSLHRVTHRNIPLTSVPEYPKQEPCMPSRSFPTEERSEVFNRAPISISPQENRQMSSQQRIEAVDQNSQGAKPRRNQPNTLPNDPHLKIGQTASRCLPGTSRLLSKAPSVNQMSSSTISQLLSKSDQSMITNTSLEQRKKELTPLKLCHRRIINSQVPQLKLDHRPDNEETVETVLHRGVTRTESNRSSISSQKTLKNEIPNKKPVSNLSLPIPKKLTALSSKLKRRSKTDLSVHSKTVNKLVSSKARGTLPVKLKKQHKRKKITRNLNASTSGSSSALELFNENSGAVGVKLIAAGQHGFMKNASTGSDSPAASFTVVNVDPFATNSIKDHTETTTRVVGTSIQEEVSKRGVHFPHPSHRSVCVQADGSDKTPCDTKALFQKLFPRINALANKRKQPSKNPSGQNLYSDFSGSRSYHDPQTVQSCPGRACGTSVNVQYASSGNVKAVVRISSNLASKYSSRCSAVWSNDMVTPIIQGVSLTPPPTQPANQSSKSVSSRSGQPKKRS